MLPAFLAEIAQLTSTEIAEIIARKYGGAMLYFPKKIGASDPLVEAVGMNAARILIKEFGGANHMIPSARAILRYLDARKLAAEGLGRNQIALRLGISARRVADLLKGFAVPPATEFAGPAKNPPRAGNASAQLSKGAA
jgi:hypothetical protein